MKLNKVRMLVALFHVWITFPSYVYNNNTATDNSFKELSLQYQNNNTSTNSTLKQASTSSDTDMASDIDSVTTSQGDTASQSVTGSFKKKDRRIQPTDVDNVMDSSIQPTKVSQKRRAMTDDDQNKQWVTNTQEMYNIIQTFQQQGSISLTQQQKFKTLLMQMQNHVKNLDENKHQIDIYKSKFLNPYKSWATQILSPLATSQKAEQDIRKSKKLLTTVKEQVERAATFFIQDANAILSNLGAYSKAAVNQFYADLSDAVQTFETRMTSIERTYVKNYYDYERAQGVYVNPLNLKPSQHDIITGIQLLTEKALIVVRAVALDLTSQTASADFANQTAAELARFEKQAANKYEQILEQNKQSGKTDWWDDLKQTGQRVVDRASDQIAEETAKVIVNIATEVGSAAAEDIGEFAKDKVAKLQGKVPDSVKKKLSDLENKLASQALKKVLGDKDPSTEGLRKIIKLQYPVDATQKETEVQVKTSLSLDQKEKTFIANRRAKVEQVLQEEFDIDQPLRLAFSFSGGGNRAMVGTLGMMIGAARYKFLDATMYVTGLSGSTWTIAPWSYMYLKGLLSKNYETSLQQLQQMYGKALDYSCMASVKGACPPEQVQGQVGQSLIKDIAKRFAYDQQLTAINIWGGLVGNFALQKVGDERLNVVWSELTKLAQSGDVPLPLCSSVFDLKTTAANESGYRTEYEWFETGPFEAGSTVLGFVPVWSLGSQFKNGTLTEHKPEYSMATWLGVYGSAFAISLNDVIDKGLPMPSFKFLGKKITLPVDTWVRKMLDTANENVRAKRPEANHAQFPNYSQGVSTSALKDREKLGMFDGGMYFNIPLPLLFDRSERAVDVVIMYDSNHGDVPTLVDASRYFKRKGIAMPDMENVTQSKLMSQPMTVFNDPRNKRKYNAEQPTLIYFPTPKSDISQEPYNIDTTDYPDVTFITDNSKPPYVTTNFKYTAADVNNLVSTMDAVFSSQVDAIKEIMQKVAKNRLELQNKADTNTAVIEQSQSQDDSGVSDINNDGV